MGRMKECGPVSNMALIYGEKTLLSPWMRFSLIDDVTLTDSNPLTRWPIIYLSLGMKLDVFMAGKGEKKASILYLTFSSLNRFDIKFFIYQVVLKKVRNIKRNMKRHYEK